jgi:hypothetical protein
MSERSLAATFRSAPVSEQQVKEKDVAKEAKPRPGAAAPKTDESAYLAQQAVDAQAAIKRTLKDLKTGLAQGANPSGWVREYPWISLGASVVAGFVATAAVVPSKEERALRKLARIERALHPEPPPAAKHDRDDNGRSNAGDYKSGRQSFGRAILGEVLKAVQPALLSMLTAGVTAKVVEPENPPTDPGAAQPTPAGSGTAPTGL